jgi:hypothetical protein
MAATVVVALVTGAESLARAMAVRAVCFMEENGYPAEFVFDHNDYLATHVLVTADGEPIGSVRVRWFASFAQIERTGFRKAWRDPRIIKRTAEFIFEHAARKGYARVVTIAAPEYARLWTQMLGFRREDGAPAVGPHGEELVKLVRDLAPRDDAVSLESDAARILAQEDAWAA